MPSSSKKSYGPDIQARVRGLLQALLEGVAGDRELERLELKWAWSEDGKKLTIETTLRSLVQLSQPKLLANTPEFEKAKAQAREALIDLRDFVKILDDHRTQKRGSEKWHFSLRLWGQDTVRNLEEFDKLWESKRSPAAKPKPVPETQSRSPLKPGAPFPRVRLPENYVERPDALSAVKKLLLVASEQTLVVSAIAGLGGLGKSVLAAALVLDQEVQTRFPDGILWVTLGQSPDLQTMLGEWIRELDKSREAFSANTLESASRYLDSLLAERQMLLVVDDVWNAAHSDWFRVGGVGCRVLVTTREAQIEGAEYYPLDLMSEEEAIALVQKKIGRRWKAEQEAEVKAFAKVLGYLPLALDLATNQVRDGLSWAELRSEFEAERRAVALEVLDASEAWELLNEEQQRKYSLRASFNLSLRRLQPDQLRRFAWLGVLPEDTNLEAQVAAVLWDLPLLQTKKGLIDLRRRSFLTEGVAMIEGEPTYRIHDLMHDMARSLIAEGTLKPEIQLSSDTTQNLPLAHRLFLQRYRERAIDHCWNKLPNDGYIHRHLTWHMEQAEWAEEVHALMAMSDERGRNAWFEACDKIGQPAIFVEDVARGWRLAEASYEGNSGNCVEVAQSGLAQQSRGRPLTDTYQRWEQRRDNLQKELTLRQEKSGELRQALAIEAGAAIRFQLEQQIKVEETQLAALSAELDKLESEMERARISQIPETSFERNKGRAIKLQCRYALITATLNSLVANLPIGMMAEFVKRDFWTVEQAWAYVEQMQDESQIAAAIKALTLYLSKSLFHIAVAKARSIQDESRRAEVLRSLAQLDSTYFSEALEAARSIQDESRRARVLRSLAQLDSADFAALLEAARSIQHESSRAEVLGSLSRIDSADFAALLEAARSIQHESSRAEVLRSLAQLDSTYFSEALEAARSIQDESSRAEVLRSLAQLDSADFAALLEAARSIQDESRRAEVLRSLAQLDSTYFSEALEAARSIQDESRRTEVLRSLAQLDSADFAALLEAARSIQHESSRAEVLGSLSRIDTADFAALLEAAHSIQDESRRAEVLRSLAQLDSTYFSEALEAARSIQHEEWRAEVLRSLAQLDSTYFSEALEAAHSIQDESRRAEVLCSLAQLDSTYFSEALEAAHSIQHEEWRAEVLRSLAQLDSADFAALLEAARSIQDESSRAEVLRSLAQLDSADFAALLEAARSIQDESRRAEVLRSLAQLDTADFAALLELSGSIQDEEWRAWALISLSQIDTADFAALLELAGPIQDESSRAEVLRSLAQLDSADFAALLEAARSIQDESRRAGVLRSLAQLDSADFAALLEAACSIQDESRRAEVLRSLAQLDSAYFSEALEAARSIQDKSRRAEVLRSLAQLDSTYFSEALEAAHSIQHESRRTEVLISLTQLDSADFAALLEAARSIQDESRRVEVLISLAQQAPLDFLPLVYQAISDLTHKPTRANVLRNYLSRLSLATLPYSDWQTYLHILAHSKCENLMQDFVELYPAILHLGGEAAMCGVVDAMREVDSQWK